MAWWDKYLTRFGTGLLGGITFGDWVRLLRDNRFAIAPSCIPRAAAISLQSAQNSLFRRYENWRYNSVLKDIDVEPSL